jgi:transmembrane sensor
VAALDAGSILATVEDSPRHSLIDLQRGRARFDVIPSRTHAFSVRAGGVTITVMGTVFTVERIADRVGVNVERGTVRVNWGLGGKVLRAGESNWFPPLVVESRSDAASKPSATSRSQDRPPAEVVPTLALSHTDVAAAPAVAGGTTAPRQDARPIMRTDSVGDLLAAADIARMDGRAKDGVLILQSVLRDHGADPRAPLAAFTLGRVLMMELGQPREAATAFARTRSLAPGGAFAEDALARETEAWVKAGEPSFARAKALEYLRTYPQGRRVDSVKALGGID